MLLRDGFKKEEGPACFLKGMLLSFNYCILVSEWFCRLSVIHVLSTWHRNDRLAHASKHDKSSMFEVPL